MQLPVKYLFELDRWGEIDNVPYYYDRKKPALLRFDRFIVSLPIKLEFGSAHDVIRFPILVAIFFPLWSLVLITVFSICVNISSSKARK